MPPRKPLKPRHQRDLKNPGQSDAYRASLAAALPIVLAFLSGLAGAGFDPLSSASRSDVILREFVQASHDSGRSVAFAVLGVLAFQHHSGWKGRLPRSWAAVKVWKNSEPSMPRLPIPLGLVVLLFQLGMARAQAGRGLERCTWVMQPLMWVVAFAALLRPGECCNLLRGDITLPSDIACASGGEVVLALVAAKNRRSMGLYQFALVEDFWIIQWLQWVCTDLPANACLVSGSSGKFRENFAHLLHTLSLSGFTLASLRTGGATQQFRDHRNLGRLQYAGRWSNEKTVRHYLQEALSRRISNQFNADVLNRMALAQAIRPFLAPPSVSFRDWVGADTWTVFLAAATKRGTDEQHRRMRLGATRDIVHGVLGSQHHSERGGRRPLLR